MPDSATSRSRPSSTERPTVVSWSGDRRPSGRARGQTSPTSRSPLQQPGGLSPSPFRTYGRDIAAILLVAAGVSILLSLALGGKSVHLGTLLEAFLGWGAPASGIGLILMGVLVGIGPRTSAGADVRSGLVILFVGFIASSGLAGIDAAANGGHGGDVGHALVMALRGCLQPIVGSGAWYSCAWVAVVALNLVGFVFVTGRPLAYWVRVIRLGCRAIGDAVVTRRLAVRQARQARMADADAVTDNSVTRKGRPSRRAAIPDLATALTEPAQVVERFSPLHGLEPLDAASGGQTGPEAVSGATPAEPRNSATGAACSDDLPPLARQAGGRGRSLKSSFLAGLDALLPPSHASDEDRQAANEFLDSGGRRPKRVSLEDAIAQADGNTGVDAEEWGEACDGASMPAGEEAPTWQGTVGQGAPGSVSGQGADAAGSASGVADIEDAEDHEDLHCSDGDLDASPGGPDESDAAAGAPNAPRAAGRRSGAKLRQRGPDNATLKLDLGFDLPQSAILNPTPPQPRKSQDEARATVLTLERTLQEFKVEAKVVEIAEGPTLTRYEIQLAPGILVRKILSLADNIAMALAAIDVRVEAPIPGKSAIGVEIPKRNPGVVGLREMVDTPQFRSASKLTFALGRDVTGAAQYADLARMPHLLIAGSTGAGKSACLNALVTSLLFRCQPSDLRLVLIDPKRVELSLYDGIPHLCHQIVRDSRRAPQALGRVMQEMDRRYLLLQEARTRDITGYNSKVDDPSEKLPYIVVVIDELADLMMTSGAETEHGITRLAQLARAVGIHLVVATQRPSVDIVTGKIKANVSSRIAFAVYSGTDSRTILDCQGAERLIGRGDMLFLPLDAGKPRRIQGAFISESELERVVDFWRAQGTPDYYLERTPAPDAEMEPTGDANDEMYSQAVRVVLSAGQASTSMIQRKLKIGYNRAATLIELMEENGIVAAQDGVRPREVLVSRDQWEASQASGL